MRHQYKCCDHSTTATQIITNTTKYDTVAARLNYIILITMSGSLTGNQDTKKHTNSMDGRTDGLAD